MNSTVRNAYQLIDFGDFVDGSDENVADPYIQLLSITDRAKAHEDFVNVRLNGTDTTGSQAPLLSQADAKHSPSTGTYNSTSESEEDLADNDVLASASNNSSENRKKSFVRSVAFVIILSVIGALVVAIIACLLFRRLRTRRSNVRNEPLFVPQMAGSGAYAPLVDPRGYQLQQHQQHQMCSRPTYGGYGGSGYQEPNYQYGGRNV
jgi:hypothetical protein